VVGNLLLADAPIGGSIKQRRDNLAASISSARNYLKSPSFSLGTLDLYPLPGQCQGSALDLALFAPNSDYDLDFNGSSKTTHIHRGAYAGSGTSPGWHLTNDLKVGSPSAGVSAPAAPQNLPKKIRPKRGPSAHVLSFLRVPDCRASIWRAAF
jgi:hypothetical protein